MINPHIESLVFEAQTETGEHLHCRFAEISYVDTVEDRFLYQPPKLDQELIACRYSSLRLLEPEAVLEARLKAVS